MATPRTDSARESLTARARVAEQRDERRRGRIRAVRRGLVGLLVLCALLFGVYALATVFDAKDDTTVTAPWAKPGAPDVRPAPLDAQ